MDLVEDIYKVFKKLKTDAKEYLEGRDKNKDGMISEIDLKVMVNDFCRLGFTTKEIEILVRRYEHPIKKGMVDIAPLIEDLHSFKKKDLQEESKGLSNPSKSTANSKTPIDRIETLKFSTRHPTNVHGSKSYSMKNTSCGRQGATTKHVDLLITEHEELLEEIMKQTFINDMFVEDYFKQQTKHSDLEFDEFKKAMAGINLDNGDSEIKALYTAISGKNKRAYISDIDIAVESTVKRNIEECQKLILDDVYSSLKSDPLINFIDVFAKFEASATNKITFNQFVSTLEPKCLNIEPCNLVLLAKRYCTKYDDEVYYKDLVTDLEKLSKNVDPTKEWLLEVCVNVQKSLVCKNESLYKFFVQYADNNDRINKKEFGDAMRALKLNEIYDTDKIDNFYYYCDINKSGTVSLNELQKTVRQYCTKDLTEFSEDIVDFIADRLRDKRISFADFEEDVEKLIDPKDKAKFIKASEVQKLLGKDLRLGLSTIDEQLLFFYYKDRSDARYFNYDKFLNKLSTIMKNKDGKIQKVARNQSSMQFTEEEVNKILKHISTQIEENKIDLNTRVRKFDKYERLSEDDFKKCFDFKGLNLKKDEISTLFNKYFNTLDDRVYVDQLLIDLKKFDIPSRPSSGRSNRSEHKAFVAKMARFVQKNKKQDRLIDEMFMTDKYNDGFLSESKIKDAFHNSDVKISSKQLTEFLSDFQPKRRDEYDYVRFLIAMFGETDQIRRNRDRAKRGSRNDKYSKTTKGDEDRNSRTAKRDKDRDEDRLGKRRGSRTSSIDSRRSNDSKSLNRRESKSRDRSRDNLDRSDRSLDSKRSMDSRRSNRSDRSGRSNRSRRSDTSARRDLRDRTESKSPYGRDKTDSPSPRGRTSTKNRDPSLNVRRDDSYSKSKGRDDSSPRDRSSASPIRNEKSRSHGRDNPLSISPRESKSKSRPIEDVKGRPEVQREPKKSNLKKPSEMTSMTRFVGSRIKMSKMDYIAVFKDVNNNHPSKLINDKELIKALRALDVKLEHGDEDKLLLEIDTQNIRNAKRFFSYEKFLQKAGLALAAPEKPKTETEKLVELKMTKAERKEAEDTIEEIKKELKFESVTLYEAVDIRPSDLDIPWVTFKNGIEDHLKKYWIKFSSNKDKQAILKLYLCGDKNSVIEVDWINKVFGIEPKRPATHNDEDDLFKQEEGFKGDERINKQISRESGRKSQKSQLAYSDEEEYDHYENAKQYEKDKLKLDGQGRTNMVVNDLLQDLKTKEIDFDKTFSNKTGYYSDEEFIAILQKIEFSTKSADELDLLRSAFRDDKQRSKISINKIKQRLNTIDPSYLNKNAVKSGTDAKQRLALLPEKIQDNVTRIDNFFKRKDLDIRQIFKQMDKNQDGTISKEEFCRVIMREHKISGFDLRQLEETYSALDINKDNNLSVGEFMFYFEGAKRSEEDRKKQMSQDVKDQMKFEIGKLFEEFDNGNKGFIIEKDLYQILKASGMYIERSACQQIIRENDKNGDGKMSRQEFEDVMMIKMMNELIEDEDSINDLNSMFHQADINKDGYLTIDELDIMFKQHDTNITYEDLVVLMKEIDVDGDGRLDIDEFIALMTMDHSSFKNEKSGNTLMKMKRSGKKPAYDFVKYFKVMPTQFIESFTTRLWNKRQNLPSSVFEPKINPDTLLYRDLKKDMIPDVKKDAPVLSFQLSLADATGVPYPKSDPKDKTNDLKVIKREVRVCLYNGRTGQYIYNSATVAALQEVDNPDKWKFNTWKKVVGPNPLIFTSKDKEIVEIDEVQIIFEFVAVCKGGNSHKDISCGFASLPMKEFKGTVKKTKFYLDIKGGSPETPIDSDPFNFSDNLGMFQKMKRGTIKSRLRIDLRYYDTISEEGKFNICMLPSTCIINKKLLHFLSGYRYYLSKELCKETTDNAGFVVPSGNHVIKTFPFIIDNPDVCEMILKEWHNSVSKLIPKSNKKNMNLIAEKAEAYISRLYIIKYADFFDVVEGKEFESAIADEKKYKMREDLINHALKADMPKISYNPAQKLESMTTFKPFNIRELELDVFDEHLNRVMFYQQEFEQKGLRTNSKSKSKVANRSRQARQRDDSRDLKEDSLNIGIDPVRNPNSRSQYDRSDRDRDADRKSRDEYKSRDLDRNRDIDRNKDLDRNRDLNRNRDLDSKRVDDRTRENSKGRDIDDRKTNNRNRPLNDRRDNERDRVTDKTKDLDRRVNDKSREYSKTRDLDDRKDDSKTRDLAKPKEEIKSGSRVSKPDRPLDPKATGTRVSKADKPVDPKSTSYKSEKRVDTKESEKDKRASTRVKA